MPYSRQSLALRESVSTPIAVRIPPAMAAMMAKAPYATNTPARTLPSETFEYPASVASSIRSRRLSTFRVRMSGAFPRCAGS